MMCLRDSPISTVSHLVHGMLHADCLSLPVISTADTDLGHENSKGINHGDYMLAGVQLSSSHIIDRRLLAALQSLHGGENDAEVYAKAVVAARCIEVCFPASTEACAKLCWPLCK